VTDEDRREGHLASRPGGRRHHDRRKARPGDPVEPQEIFRLGTVGRHDGHGLGHVHGAASPDPDHDIAFALQGEPGALVGLLEGGFRQHPVVKDGLHAPPVKHLRDPVPHAQLGQVAVDSHEGLFRPKVPHLADEPGKGAAAEDDLFRSREGKGLVHESILLQPPFMLMEFTRAFR